MKIATLFVVLSAIAVALGGPTDAVSQTVVGVITEAESAEPLVGAWVVLETPSGVRHGGTLTNSEGRYVIRAPGAGEYHLVVEMIGFASTVTDPVVVGDGESVRQDIRVSRQAIDLTGIRVEVGQRCRPRPGSGPSTERLWNEARKALEVAVWTDQQSVRFKTYRYRRVVDPVTFEVEAQEFEAARSGHYEASPYQSIPADSLREHGFVQRAPDGQLDYYGPDAEVLLSDVFLDTHCFRLVGPRSTSESNLVGLGFEPVPGHSEADIEGVLWLDRTTSRLERVDFRYVQLPFGGGTSWDVVGGRVEFEKLSNGMWIVRRWRLRMPVVQWARRPERMASRRSLELAALNEVGAEVVSAVSSQGEPLAESAAARLLGTVRNGETGRVLPDARITLSGTRLGAVADSAGRYEISPLLPGRYTIRFNHPEMAALGVEDGTRSFELEAGADRVLDLEVTPSSAAAARACRGAPGLTSESATLLHGTVRDAGGDEPVPNAVVKIAASVGSEGPGEAAHPTVMADSAGVWQACIDPALGAVFVGALRPDNAVATIPRDGWTEADVSGAGFVRLDIPVAEIAASTYAGRPPLQGRVVDLRSGEPVAGAVVHLRDSTGASVHQVLTNEDGRFALDAIDEGSLALQVEAFGYVASAGSVRFTGEPLFLEVELDPQPLDVGGVAVTVDAQNAVLRAHGYYDRRRRGGGRFLGPEDVSDRTVSRASALLRGVEGVQLDGREPVFTRNLQLGFGSSCVPNLYVDGVPVRVSTDPGEGGTFDDLVPPPEQISAVEAYPGGGSTPARWGGTNAACGVIVVWTRRGASPSPP